MPRYRRASVEYYVSVTRQLHRGQPRGDNSRVSGFGPTSGSPTPGALLSFRLFGCRAGQKEATNFTRNLLLSLPSPAESVVINFCIYPPLAPFGESVWRHSCVAP